jgi:hypothetical protein
MPGESRQVILRHVVAEVVEEQEGVEVGGVAEAERAAQMTPAPSRVGLDLIRRLTGRRDIL